MQLMKVQMLMVRTFTALIVAAVLVSCGGIRDQLGLTKNPPDEFTIVTKPPLIIPPNFNLRPPVNETRMADNTEPSVDAQSVLFSEQNDGTGSNSVNLNTTARSSGELTILQMAGASTADPTIRNILMSETALIEEGDKSFADGLIFWQTNESSHQVVDAGAEAERLRENAASGLPPDAGETPTITRDNRAILGDIF